MTDNDIRLNTIFSIVSTIAKIVGISLLILTISITYLIVNQ